MNILTLALWLAGAGTLALSQPLQLHVDFSRPEGSWNMTALSLGQGGLQSDPMILPHVKELRQLHPQTIRLFLSEYYRIYPDHDRFDWTRLDQELEAVRATGAQPALALAFKPPVLYPQVDHYLVHPNDYPEWERVCEHLARHCLEKEFKVAAWEVCNEPDIGESGGTPHFFRNPDDYNLFYTHTATALKRGDPSAQVGGPAVASVHSFLVEGLIRHCAENQVPLDFVSWHLYSDSPDQHSGNIQHVRSLLARYPQLTNTSLFVSEWNMDLMRPNLDPGFQPCFVLETMRQFADQKLDRAAYYHIRDCFVDPRDFDWMSPGGRTFMAHWWNTMPQYSALFDHHDRVRPTYFVFRFLTQFSGPRYTVHGESTPIRAIAGESDGRLHILLWRFGGSTPDPTDVRLEISGVDHRNSRIVALEPEAAVNNLQVLHYGPVESLRKLTLSFQPWDIKWIEIE